MNILTATLQYRGSLKVGLCCHVAHTLHKPFGALILGCGQGTVVYRFYFADENADFAGAVFSLQVIFLDSDNMAVQDPSPLFDAPEFQQTGLVVWPDYWQASAAPELAQILKLDANILPEGTFESGQIVFNKRRYVKLTQHCPTLPTRFACFLEQEYRTLFLHPEF